MALREIRWQNFRPFQDTGWLEIRPITVLIGTNNSGKTSILDPLLILKQTLRSKRAQSALVLRGEIINSGSFSDIAHGHDVANLVTFGLRFHRRHPQEEEPPELGVAAPSVCEPSLPRKAQHAFSGSSTLSTAGKQDEHNEFERAAKAYATLGLSEAKAARDRNQAPDEPQPMETATQPDGALFAKGHNGQVTFDGRFVTISRKGAFGRMTVGKGDKRIPVRSIAAVQWKPASAVGMTYGYTQFTIAGGIERRSRPGHAAKDAMTDENSVTFPKHVQAPFEAIRVAVENAIAGDAPAPSGNAPNATDRLAELSRLHDAGILTDDEFQAKRAAIISQL